MPPAGPPAPRNPLASGCAIRIWKEDLHLRVLAVIIIFFFISYLLSVIDRAVPVHHHVLVLLGEVEIAGAQVEGAPLLPPTQQPLGHLVVVLVVVEMVVLVLVVVVLVLVVTQGNSSANGDISHLTVLTHP